MTRGSRPSPYVDMLVEAARNSGCDVSIEMVPYEFQRGGNQMMHIRSKRSAAAPLDEAAR